MNEVVSEQETLDRLKRQDPEALEALMRQYGALVLHVVRQVLGYGHDGDVEECATDAWLAVWQKSALYEPERSAMKTWICMLARHQAIDRLRRRHDPAASAMSLDDERLTSIRIELEEIPEILEARENARMRSIHLNRALEQLAEADRSLIIRRYYLYQDIQDLAREAGVSRAVIDNRLARSRKRLRTLYLEVSQNGCEA